MQFNQSFALDLLLRVILGNYYNHQLFTLAVSGSCTCHQQILIRHALVIDRGVARAQPEPAPYLADTFHAVQAN